jgi:hypothetical protein
MTYLDAHYVQQKIHQNFYQLIVLLRAVWIASVMMLSTSTIGLMGIRVLLTANGLPPKASAETARRVLIAQSHVASVDL